MNVQKTIAKTLLLILTLAGFSCAPPATTVDEPVPVVVQALVDVSGSYPALPAAVETLSSIVDQMRPGDRLTVRKLNQASYGGSAAVADLWVPVDTLGERRFDPVAQARSAATAAAGDSLRTRAKEDIRSLLQAPKASRTDIVGGLAAASEAIWFQGGAESVDPKILLFTDGKDTGPNRGAVDLDLQGMEVAFMHFETPDALSDQFKVREEWKETLELEWGASKVSFIPAGERFSLRR